MIIVDNINKDELQMYQKLRENAFSGDFIADSPKVVNILLESDIEVKSILATAEYYDEYKAFVESKNIPKRYLATKEQMQSVVGHKVHHNCMMHGVRPQQAALESLGDNIIMLDEISSTENIGSIARGAAGLGVDSYLLPNQGPHPYARRALRVSMGYVSHLKTHLYDDIFVTIESLKSMGYRIYAAEVTEDSTPLMQVKVPKKWVILMGHEGKGIDKKILDICDEVVTIEMRESVKSFNVAVAASLMMYRFKNG